MKMKRGRRFGLPEERQMMIYWLCQNYQDVTAENKEKIDRLCRKFGDPPEALHRAVTSGDRLLDVALEFGVSESVLYRQVSNFFRAW